MTYQNDEPLWPLWMQQPVCNARRILGPSPHLFSTMSTLGRGSKEKQEFVWMLIQTCPAMVSTQLMCGQKARFACALMVWPLIMVPVHKAPHSSPLGLAFCLHGNVALWHQQRHPVSFCWNQVPASMSKSEYNERQMWAFHFKTVLVWLFQSNRSNRMCVWMCVYIIYYKELAWVIMKAERFHDLQFESWRPKKSSGVVPRTRGGSCKSRSRAGKTNVQPVRQRKFPLFHLLIFFRPSIDWCPPTLVR